jgi:hypothetical protein
MVCCFDDELTSAMLVAGHDFIGHVKRQERIGRVLAIKLRPGWTRRHLEFVQDLAAFVCCVAYFDSTRWEDSLVQR